MAKRSNVEDPALLRSELIQLLTNFEAILNNDELRPKVLVLVQAIRKIRRLGSALIQEDENTSNAAKNRIRAYFRKYVGQLIQGEEFLVISGIQEYARRIRELRVQEGWQIVSGEIAKVLYQNGELNLSEEEFKKIKTDSYILLRDFQDKEAAFRWHSANVIRKEKIGTKTKLLKYLQLNVGRPVSGEELSYIANDKKEWARRIRELRTEDGWLIKTRVTGRPDLPVGMYILEDLRQSEVHDRKISDDDRINTLTRDGFCCRKCGWSQMEVKEGDPRHFLELHHIIHHAKGGGNSVENLVTLCNVHHDEIHRLDKNNTWPLDVFWTWVQNT